MEGVPGFGSGPVDIVVRTAVVYAAVVVGLRLGGKREVGQLGVIDLVALLLLANAVQNAMVGTDSSLGGGLLAGALILVFAKVLDTGTRRSPRLRRLLMGSSADLIVNGHVNRRAMEHEHISDDELQEALHEHGLEFRRQVKRATLEVNGDISIIPQPEAAEGYQSISRGDAGSRLAGRLPRSRTHGVGAAAPTLPTEQSDMPDPPTDPGETP